MHIENLTSWSEPVRVETSRGARMLRKGPIADDFWGTWRAHKAMLRDLGVSVSKNRKGDWELNWWMPLSGEAVAEANEKVEASRASDSDAAIPAPDGLEYLAYQRAGITYAMSGEHVCDER